MMYYTDTEKSESITIRLAGPQDAPELRRVAQRDSRPAPEGEALIAVVAGEIRAAISLSSGQAVADPFHPTEELVRMLFLRRSQMQGAAPRHGRVLSRLRLASS
jgi:hypothetical protein